MKAGKKLTLFLSSLLCLVAILVSACGGEGGTTPGNGSKAGDDKQILRYSVVGDPDIHTFDPAYVSDTDSNFPIQAVYTGLVTLNKKLEVVPQLAKDIQVSDDGMTYTFKLKDGLKFSNGDPLTAEDVVYSINRAIDKKTASDVAGYLQLVKGFADLHGGKTDTLIGKSLIAKDPQTVVIQIEYPAAYFLQSLTYPTSYVVNKKLIEKYGDKWTDHAEEGGGAGPFKVEKYTHNQGIDLVVNENYYGKKPQLKKLQVLFYKDQEAMYRAYQANQLEFSPVPTASLEQERTSPGFKDTPILTVRYIAMNYLVKPFDNLKIRQAFALAIDKDQVVKSAMKNSFTPTNHIVPDGMVGYNEKLTGPQGASTKGDPEKAKQLLEEGMKEAGYNGISNLPPITLTYYPRNQNFRDAINIIVQRWKNVLGVNVQVSVVTRPKLLDLTTGTKGNGNLQMWQAGWNADYPDPQDWLTLFFGKGQDYNQFNYGLGNIKELKEMKDIQDMLVQADKEPDKTKRMALYNQIEQKVVEHVGWLSLWQEKVQYLVKPNVHGLELNSQQLIPPEDWSDIYITQ